MSNFNPNSVLDQFGGHFGGVCLVYLQYMFMLQSKLKQKMNAIGMFILIYPLMFPHPDAKHLVPGLIGLYGKQAGCISPSIISKDD